MGESTRVHEHLPNVWSFAYFVNCPRGSSPLVFTNSGKKIKAEDGKIVIFPTSVRHHVPKNKCEDRVVLSGNIRTVDSSPGTYTL